MPVTNETARGHPAARESCRNRRIDVESCQWCVDGGYRGLHGGSSLSRLLAEHRGVRTAYLQPPLSLKQILCWADAHRKRTGGGQRPCRERFARRRTRTGKGSPLPCILGVWPSAWAYRAKPSLSTAGFPTEFDNRTSLGLGGQASAADGELAFGLIGSRGRRRWRDVDGSQQGTVAGKPWTPWRAVPGETAGQAPRPAGQASGMTA